MYASKDGMTYQLPDGRRVEVHNDVARGSHYITFTLANGQIVIAELVCSFENCKSCKLK
jgi:hypothetical protein